MPRVLFDLSILNTSARVRGVGRYAADLARQLARLARPGDVEVLFLEDFDAWGRPRITEDADAAVARLQDPGKLECSKNAWVYRSRLATALAARQAGVDLVHRPHTVGTPLFMSGHKSPALVVTGLDLIPLRYPAHYLDWRDGFESGRKLLDGRRFGAAQHIIAISEATAADLRQLLNVPAAKISVVHLGVDHERWRPEDDGQDEARVATLGLAGLRYLLFVGDADWRKNPDGMFRALALARQSLPDLELVWAGRLGADRKASLDAALRASGAGEAVRFVGHVDDEQLRSLYRRALATMFISRAEGFGLPVLEAMSIGCPVITSDCSSMPEITGDRGGWLVDPEDNAAAAAAVVALAEDPTLRAAQRAQGLAQAAFFTQERVANKTLEVYRAVVERRR